MFRFIRQLLSLFNRRERWQVTGLSLALVVRALVQVVGVSSIAPFMSVVADPSVVEQSEWLRWVYEGLGFSSTISFLIALGIGVVVILALSNGISALAAWGMLRFSWGMHHRLCARLLRGYLAQPYSFFVQRNSASFNKTVLSEVLSVITGVFTPTLNVLSHSMVVVAIVGLLVALDPGLAAVVVLVLGGAYGGLYMLIKRKQRRLGRESVTANQRRFKVVGEAFGGIKDVKILQREDSFLSQFVPASLTYSKARASNGVIAQVPRYLFETIAFGGIVLIVIYYLSLGQGVEQVLPMISLYAFAGYRLMPELQQLFAGLASIRFYRASLDDLTDDLEKFTLPEHQDRSPVPLGAWNAIRLNSVTFRYPGAETPALDRVSLEVPRNQTVGLVGESGSGKTTLVDLLLGLYHAEAGEIRIGNTVLDGAAVPTWKRQVGYVPQHIFLSDDTIANNIAFGVPRDEVDAARVEQAAKVAHLHEFICSLPDGFETVVGERGVRLSGGQRQRIGIARALYHDPEVLIMDEATSALDGATEDAVMQAIRELAGQKTIVLIAHRLTTVEACDRIYLLERGRVGACGTFDELLHNSAAFRSMAKRGPSIAV